MQKKVGIITFHNSYNCGSMLESYAIHKYLLKQNVNNEIIDFSSKGQKQLYSVFYKNSDWKKVVKNIILLFYKNKIEFNNEKYEEFKNKNFKLSKKYSNGEDITDDDYSVVVAGSDQIWNVTILDSDDAYFLPWVKSARKVAYAPSFGAKNISKYSNNCEKYVQFIRDFNALSIREKNGAKWLKELTGIDVDILIDPTLLLEKEDYEEILDKDITIPEKYIFFYSPGFNNDICKFIKKISEKYKLPVITWGAKNYYTHAIKTRFGFELPQYENPAVYLSLIKNATLVFTTSFHGTIFSTIFRKRFFTIKNGEMYGDDDRVITLLESLEMMERLVPYDFDENFDYLKEVDYSEYEITLKKLQEKAQNFLKENVEDFYNESSK